jgi:hypothetical protein
MSLAAYLAAGVGLAGVTGAAEAAIVNIDLTDTRGDGSTTTDDAINGPNGGVPQGSYSYFSNWLGAGSGTLLMANGYLGYSGLGAYRVLVGAGLQWALTSLGYNSPRNFAAGQAIDSSAIFSNSIPYTHFSNGSNPSSPAFGAGSYMGFRFGTVGNFNYGWLEVTWDGSLNFQILSGAYETTVNTAIAAGQGAASVPAPSPASLLALIVGGAALRRWRAGRRQQLLEQTAA